MTNHQHPPSTPAQPSQQSAVRNFFRGPGLIAVVITLAIAVWFLISFLTPEPEHKEDSGPINYFGVAEVLDISDGPSKCHVYIKRDNGEETRQKMARADCRKFRVGDTINIENGQYVSTVPNPYLGRLPH